jgi:hypothetical protein
MGPAGTVPVPAEVGGIQRHHHHMTDAGTYLLQAAGAQVGLARLEGVNEPDLERPAQRGIRAHSRMTAITAKATATMT